MAGHRLLWSQATGLQASGGQNVQKDPARQATALSAGAAARGTGAGGRRPGQSRGWTWGERVQRRGAGSSGGDAAGARGLGLTGLPSRWGWAAWEAARQSHRGHSAGTLGAGRHRTPVDRDLEAAFLKAQLPGPAPPPCGGPEAPRTRESSPWSRGARGHAPGGRWRFSSRRFRPAIATAFPQGNRVPEAPADPDCVPPPCPRHCENTRVLGGEAPLGCPWDQVAERGPASPGGSRVALPQGEWGPRPRPLCPPRSQGLCPLPCPHPGIKVAPALCDPTPSLKPAEQLLRQEAGLEAKERGHGPAVGVRAARFGWARGGGLQWAWPWHHWTPG